MKVTVQFRGREVSHAYIGRDLLTRFGDDIKDHGTVDRQPLLEGKSMSMTVASTHKPKIDPPRRRATRPLPRGPRNRRPPQRAATGAAGGRRLSQMPKMKTHKGAQKRFGLTGSGKVYRVKSWRGHHLEIKSSSRTRRYAGKAIVDPTSARAIQRLLPNL